MYSCAGILFSLRSYFYFFRMKADTLSSKNDIIYQIPENPLIHLKTIRLKQNIQITLKCFYLQWLLKPRTIGHIISIFFIKNA